METQVTFLYDTCSICFGSPECQEAMQCQRGSYWTGPFVSLPEGAFHTVDVHSGIAGNHGPAVAIYGAVLLEGEVVPVVSSGAYERMTGKYRDAYRAR